MVDEEEVDGPSPRRVAGVPTVAILSLREVRPEANYGGLREAEDVLVELLSAGLYRVMVSSPRFSSGRLSRPAVRSLLSTTRMVKPFHIEHRQSGGASRDVLLVLVRDLADAQVLVGLPNWHTLGERVMVHVENVTDRDLRRYPEVVVHLRKRADALFVASEMPPLSYLTTLHGRLRTVAVVPPMLDVLAFPARQDSAQRTIDVFCPGKVPAAQNQLLRSWADRNDGSYQHGIGELGGLTSEQNRRAIFISMATKARVFVTNHSAYGARSGLHLGVDTRFFEAMAAGCVLAGDLPRESRMFAEYIAPAEPLGFDTDARGIPEAMLATLADPAVSKKQGRLSRAAALRANDVAHRWKQMAEAVGLLVAPTVTERIDRLAGLAEHGEPDTPPGRGPSIDRAPVDRAPAGGAPVGDGPPSPRPRPVPEPARVADPVTEPSGPRLVPEPSSEAGSVTDGGPPPEAGPSRSSPAGPAADVEPAPEADPSEPSESSEPQPATVTASPTAAGPTPDPAPESGATSEAEPGAEPGPRAEPEPNGSRSNGPGSNGSGPDGPGSGGSGHPDQTLHRS